MAESFVPTIGIMGASTLGTILYVFLNIGSAIFAYVFGALGDRYNKGKLLALAYLIFSVYCIGFVVLSPTVLTYASLLLLAGVETGAIDSTARAYAAELLSKRERGTGLGVMSTIDGVGDFMSSTIAGSIWALCSSILTLVYGSIFGFVAMAVLLVLHFD